MPSAPQMHIGPRGFEIAALSCGGVLAAVEAVMAGRLDNAYCLVRPPGHHAEADAGHGFCCFSNVSLAADHALATLGAKRVAIVDWDVHHGERCR
jgi:acetoin utilization deacetylase AcuC-like enzyme